MRKNMRKIQKLTLKATFNFMKINVSFPLQFTVNSYMFWCNSIKKTKQKTPNNKQTKKHLETE